MHLTKHILLITYILCVFCIPFIKPQDVAYLFAHGLSANKKQAYYYKELQSPLLYTHSDATSLLWLLHDPLFTFNFPDAIGGFDNNKTSLAQQNEIDALANAYEKIKHNHIVLMGMSRGASTIINFLGSYAPQAIAAVIVESPFDSIIDTLDNHCKSHWWIPAFIRHTAPNVLFGKFDRNGICPINVADKISKDIPILMIASLQDSLIPAANTASIYLKLLEHGHEHVYFLLLNAGEHAYLLEDTDALVYLNTVHAFYKHYNLPHLALCAADGQNILAQCKPTKKTIEKALKNKKSFISLDSTRANM